MFPPMLRGQKKGPHRERLYLILREGQTATPAKIQERLRQNDGTPPPRLARSNKIKRIPPVGPKDVSVCV